MAATIITAAALAEDLSRGSCHPSCDFARRRSLRRRFQLRGVQSQQQPSHSELKSSQGPACSSSALKYPEDSIRDLQNFPRSTCRKVNGSRKTRIPCRTVRKLSMRLKSWSTSAEVRSASRYSLGIRHGEHQDTADAGCRLRCQIGNPGQRDDKM